jgi:hypothetical protein
MNTSRRSFTVAAAFIVFARVVATARNAAGGSAIPASARNKAPTGRSRQLAEAVLAASGNEARLAAVSEGAAAKWLSALKKALPEAEPGWAPVMEAVIQDELRAWNDDITRINVGIYASKFTDAQLLDMLVFYRTEGGRALVAQTPAIIREKTEIGRKLSAEILPRLMTATRARVGHG